jgi:hypothetical protein
MNYRKTSNQDSLRRSQLITTFGVGSIVDLSENRSVMICSPDKWRVQNAPPIHDNRLEEKLGVQYFVTPPDMDDKSNPGGIPAVVFPRWMRCSRLGCGILMPLKEWRERARLSASYKDFDVTPYCFVHHNASLVPSRFVVACGKGHIDDFPYVAWVHRKRADGTCVSPQLRYKKSSGSSLESIRIECTGCNTTESMAGSFKKDNLKFHECSGSEPWLKRKGRKCGGPVVALQRGGTNTYFPTVRSSILIPPYSSDVPLQLENVKKVQDDGMWEAYKSSEGALDLDALVIPSLRDRTGMTEQEIRDAIRTLENPPAEEEAKQSEEAYRKQEFDAFTKGSSDAERIDFVLEPMELSDYETPLLKSVVLVKKLREVRAQTGFTRIKPLTGEEGGGGEGKENDIVVQQVSLKPYGKFPWLPAYEVRGEGIFLEFDLDDLSRWAAKPEVKGRYTVLARRLVQNPDPYKMISSLDPQFVFLHSFAHMFIKQLSYECGYSSSALRERIFSSTQPGYEMGGVLIYTADGDADGTLGGLVRQGEPDRLDNTIRSALKNAQWCSIDPLCIDSRGQGFQQLNLGACHSCILLPETSCEFLNRFLDRGSAIGTPEQAGVGLFDGYHLLK